MTIDGNVLPEDRAEYQQEGITAATWALAATVVGAFFLVQWLAPAAVALLRGLQ